MKSEAGAQVSQLKAVCGGKRGDDFGAANSIKNRTKKSASLLSMAKREPNWSL
jgi:hypothetical protein